MSRRAIYEQTASRRGDAATAASPFLRQLAREQARDPSNNSQNHEHGSRSLRRLPVGVDHDSRSRHDEPFGSDGGFMSMSRFASMSFDEARSNLHPTVQSSIHRSTRAGGGRSTAIRDPTRMDEYQMLQLLDEDVVKRGVSDRKLRSLPIKSVDRRMVGKEKCHICQCEYATADRVMELPCKHSFHPDCIKGWFKENRTCPVCRFEVEA